MTRSRSAEGKDDLSSARTYWVDHCLQEWLMKAATSRRKDVDGGMHIIISLA